jgi:hypothetical protein
MNVHNKNIYNYNYRYKYKYALLGLILILDAVVGSFAYMLTENSTYIAGKSCLIGKENFDSSIPQNPPCLPKL